MVNCGRHLPRSVAVTNKMNVNLLFNYNKMHILYSM